MPQVEHGLALTTHLQWRGLSLLQFQRLPLDRVKLSKHRPRLSLALLRQCLRAKYFAPARVLAPPAVVMRSLRQYLASADVAVINDKVDVATDVQNIRVNILNRNDTD